MAESVNPTSSDLNSVPMCSLDEIGEDSSKGFEVNDQALFAVKKDGQLVIYRNHCPHLGVELNWQEDQFLDMDGMLIQCSTHGALFLIESGECVAGPCLGKYLESLPFDIVDGVVYLNPQDL